MTPHPNPGPPAGVVESVLARVMDAFQVRMQGALLAASVKALSESPSVARLMAAEPAAPQAGSAVAFFTGRHSDNVDAFVTDVLNNTGAACRSVEYVSRQGVKLEVFGQGSKACGRAAFHAFHSYAS